MSKDVNALPQRPVAAYPTYDFAAEPLARIQLPPRVPIGFHGNRVEEAS